MRPSALASFVGLFVPLSMMAQDRTLSSTSVATDFFDAMARRDWTAAAALVDREVAAPIKARELAGYVWLAAHRDEVRHALLAIAESPSGGRDLEPNEPVDGRPDTAALRMHGGYVLHVFGGATLREVASWSPEEFLVRAIDAADSRPFLPPDGAAEPRPRARRRVLGVVTESDTTAHALYRVEAPERAEPPPESAGARTAQEADDEDPRMLRLRKRGARWYVRPHPEVLSGPRSLFFRELELEFRRDFERR